jgi:hypothetical protein
MGPPRTLEEEGRRREMAKRGDESAPPLLLLFPPSLTHTIARRILSRRESQSIKPFPDLNTAHCEREKTFCNVTIKGKKDLYGRRSINRARERERREGEEEGP